MFDAEARGDEAFRICHDDRCVRLGVHPEHDIFDTSASLRERRRKLGWGFNPLEPDPEVDYKMRYEHPRVLDASVVRVLSLHIPKPTSMIQQELIDDYGNIDQRRLYRSLTRLKRNQRIVHVNLSRFRSGGHIGAYMLPGAKIARDPLAVLAILDDMLPRADLDRYASSMR